jgi:hypothetical protein
MIKGMSPRKDAIYATCRDCGREHRRIVGRGLCGGCYDRHWNAGTLDLFPRLTRPPKPIPTEKACAICRIVQPLENFARNNRRPDGRGSYCKPCAREKYQQPAVERKRSVEQPVEGEQKCRECGEVKPYNEYHWESDKGRYRYRCRSCVYAQSKAYWRAEGSERQRARQLQKKYGITVAEFDAMLAAQRGGCAICSAAVNPNARSLAVDHCHKTGKVRGILCGRCNLAIGQFDDDPDLLRRAVMYLRG